MGNPFSAEKQRDDAMPMCTMENTHIREMQGEIRELRGQLVAAQAATAAAEAATVAAARNSVICPGQES